MTNSVKFHSQEDDFMLYVGIDVAKAKHDLSVIDDNGTILTKNFRFENSFLGFRELQNHLEQLFQQTNDSITIALEDTGHYAYNLLAFLHKHGYQTFTYNPLLIKEFARSLSLRKTKTDKKDALTIARKLREDVAPEHFTADTQIQELKFLTRHQSRLIHNRSKAKTHYVRLLDVMFPELTKIVGNVHNKYVYELLASYPTPAKMARARFNSLLKIKRLTTDKASQIQEAARQTIGTVSPSLSLELKQTILTIQHYSQQIDEIEKEIALHMAEMDSPITTITGIGTRLGAIILAEIRNIHNFKNPAQLQAFAGMEPSVYQSGQMDVQGHMVKRGSPYLRCALFLAAQKIAHFSPHFRTYLNMKLAQGKHYYVAISHVAKKLIRVIYYLLKNNLPFDEAKLT